jgi:predicted glycosyltransferase
MRAEALARRGLVRVLHPAELTPARLGREVRRLLAGGEPPRSLFSLGGLDGFVEQIDELAAAAADERAAPAREAAARG